MFDNKSVVAIRLETLRYEHYQVGMRLNLQDLILAPLEGLGELWQLSATLAARNYVLRTIIHEDTVGLYWGRFSTTTEKSAVAGDLVIQQRLLVFCKIPKLKVLLCQDERGKFLDHSSNWLYSYVKF